MLYLIFKYAVTSGLVVLISEIAKRSDKIGGLIASLPIVTILTLLWLQFEKAEQEKISNHAYYTFWFVLPTLPMFLVFPKLYASFGFWSAIGLCILLTVALFFSFNLILERFGIKLL
ncbi:MULTISPECIES: DUF3147 family protein [Leptospira]|uniref:DUF3147 family protein n=2 Tax=Leptospira TaxID=171 RepID=A0A2M9ZZC8_9LEPT|nr:MULTISPECIES: DUF3147 family protein [Leptospira]PJZ77422.1 hypothetical protein CH365_07485 [Leptospira neocaledonica]PKA16841.1 hypothetical protein CH363_05440 [Leptospira haakeii]PKA19268.1 hypothetical protein CH377_13160 [Leptospira haakeii]